MKTNVSNLSVSTVFTYEGLTYKVINRYPFIEAKCIKEPNDYKGLNVLFCRHADEIVEVTEGTQILKQRTRTIYNLGLKAR